MGFLGFVSAIDRFGQPVTVNFRGDATYRTFGGAFFSVITYLIVMAFAAVQWQQLISLNDPNITQTVEFVNYATDTNKYNMREQELDAVIKFEVMQPGRTNSWEVLTERYGRIVAYLVAQEWPFTVERRL